MLHIPRFFLGNDLNQITDSEQIRQIIKVFRLKQNNQIIGIHNEKEYLLQIVQIDKSCLKMKVIEEHINNKELPFNLKVFLPLLKGDKNDFILQKLTEIGVNEFCFIPFEYSVKLSHNLEHKMSRWQKIVLEAAEQSERVTIPSIQFLQSFNEISLQSHERGFAFVERLEKDAGFDGNLLKDHNSKALIFGPEGGFSPAERKQIIQKGFQDVSLGKRILRAETAIILGVGLFSINF